MDAPKNHKEKILIRLSSLSNSTNLFPPEMCEATIIVPTLSWVNSNKGKKRGVAKTSIAKRVGKCLSFFDWIEESWSIHENYGACLLLLSHKRPPWKWLTRIMYNKKRYRFLVGKNWIAYTSIVVFVSAFVVSRSMSTWISNLLHR